MEVSLRPKTAEMFWATSSRGALEVSCSLCGTLPSRPDQSIFCRTELTPDRYYLDGKVVEVSGPELMGTAKPYHIYPGLNALALDGLTSMLIFDTAFAFVAYPNRDSTPYRERYNSKLLKS